MQTKVRLRDQKDHFVTTLYKEFREKLQISQSSILLLKINNQEIIRIPNQDFHITIPKRIIKLNKKVVKIKILKIYDKNDAKKRDRSPYSGHKLNIRAFMPKKTIFGKDLFALENGFDSMYVWYSVGGGARPIKIKKFINGEKIAEFLGFYSGDGNTSHTIRSFRITNCELSTLNYCLDILEELCLSRKEIKVQVIYSSDKDKLSLGIKRRCISYWSRSLKINKKQIISVNRSKNKRETLRYGSAKVLIDNCVLVEIFLHGLLKKIKKIVQNPSNNIEKKIAIGFFRGLLAAEGFVLLHKGSLRTVGIAFNPHSNELELYKKILENLGIYWKRVHGNALIIHKFENFKRICELDGFKFHKKRNEKFISGLKKHRFFNSYF